MNIEQEIRAQIEKNRDLKLEISEINNHLSILEGLLRNERDDVQKQVDEAYKKGYDKGYTDKTNNDEVCKELAKDAYQRGFNDGKEYGLDESDMREAVSYQKGLDDAWEAARKISLMPPDEIEKVFPGAAKYNRYNLGYSGVEAIAKLKAYEEKKADDEIKVGDEVVSNFTKTKGILLEPETEHLLATVIVPSLRWRTINIRHANLKKTGKHYDIEKLLEAMKE